MDYGAHHQYRNVIKKSLILKMIQIHLTIVASRLIAILNIYQDLSELDFGPLPFLKDLILVELTIS